MEYLRELERRAAASGTPADIPVDFLADYWSTPDRDAANLVVHRDEHGMILLNRYPYAGGHLLVALGDGRPALLDYPCPARRALWELVELATDLMHRAINPQGINTGINEGRAAGAGLPGHLHVHLVPRWTADTNFITVTGGVRVVPESLERMHEMYVTAMPAVLADRDEPAG